MKNCSHEIKGLLLLVLALFWCGCLLVVRSVWVGNLQYGFLVWNLGLAAAPVVFSTLASRQWRMPLRLLFGLLWMLFLPNAFYIITDFVHLRTLQSGPIWLDILLLFSCAATGLAMGFFSLSQIHNLVNKAVSSMLGWAIATSSILLSGFGIYLGRFLRWRSIDIALNPGGLVLDIVDRIINPLIHLRTWGVTFGFGVMLLLGYLVYLAGSRSWVGPPAIATTAPQR